MRTLNRRTAVAALATGAACALSGGAAWAQSGAWPTQTVKIVVPYAPGGAVDIIARLMAQELALKWGQAVIVDNKPGAGTQIGTDFTAKSRDGYTLLMTAAPFTVNPGLFTKMPYDTFKDFVPVALAARSGLFLVTSSKQTFSSVKDLIEEGKSVKGMTVASPGNGSMSHMAAELTSDLQKLNMTHAPYRGTPQAQTDVIGGQVQFMFDNPSTALPLIKDGKFKALAYTGSRRSKALPNVPTMAEAGVTGFEAINWFGLVAPSTMSVEAIDRIAADCNTVLRKREIIERFAKEGVETGGIPREAFGAFLAVETIKWAKIIKSRNIKPD